MNEKHHESAICLIALGSNLENPAQQVESAVAAIGQHPDCEITARASLYRSAPVGFTAQPDFINSVIEVRTQLAPHALLALLMEIEQRFGRTRRFANAPRTLDLDILLYNQEQIHTNDLILPHPRMHQRAFVLRPLLEIRPDTHIPGLGAAQNWLNHTREQVAEKVTS